MGRLKKLRNFIDILKDKASLIQATLSITKCHASVNVAVLHATTHNPSPPSEKCLAAVLNFGNRSRLTACACIEVLMDRLHDSQSASVALKCLLTIHNVINRGSFILKDQLSFYPSCGGKNFLNLSNFRDNSDVETWELSIWVRWYAGLLEQSLMVSRVLGYYFCSCDSNIVDNKDKEQKVLSLLNSELLNEINVLVDFTERICDAPDSLQVNSLVFEVMRIVSEDFMLVQSEIFVRVMELGNRMESMIYGTESTQFFNVLKRLEDCKERLNRADNDGFWDLIRQTKKKVLMVKEKREEMRLAVVTMGHRDESAVSESTRFGKQIADSG